MSGGHREMLVAGETFRRSLGVHLHCSRCHLPRWKHCQTRKAQHLATKSCCEAAASQCRAFGEAFGEALGELLDLRQLWDPLIRDQNPVRSGAPGLVFGDFFGPVLVGFAFASQSKTRVVMLFWKRKPQAGALAAPSFREAACFSWYRALLYKGCPFNGT